MTIQIDRKPQTQQTQFLLHQKLNELLNESQAIEIQDFERKII